MSAENEAIEQWASNVIRAWEDKIVSLGVVDTKELLNSLQHHVTTHSNGDYARIDFVFNLYGKFEDMGASRGHTYYDPRSKKPWLRAEFFAQVRTLRLLLGAEYFQKTRKVMVIDGAGVGNLL